MNPSSHGPTATQAVPPEMAARYEMDPRIVGRGSSGEVHRGRDRGARTDVAIKCVPTQSLGDGGRESLVAEIKILQSCRHRNIVELIDFFWSKSHIFIIMEWCDLGDLSTFVRQGQVLPEKFAVGFLRQLAAALRYLRQRSITHQDLKPANLLLKSTRVGAKKLDPSTVCLKVADFGIAQMIQQGGVSSRARGTVLFMAPEIVTQPSFGPGIDLWSTGAILHQALFGWPPLHPPSPQQGDIDAALRRLGASSSNPLRLPDSPQVTPECEDLLARLLQPQPLDRLSFEDFFRHALVDLPTLEKAQVAAAAAQAQQIRLESRLPASVSDSRVLSAEGKPPVSDDSWLTDAAEVVSLFSNAGKLYLALANDEGSTNGKDSSELARAQAAAMIGAAERIEGIADTLRKTRRSAGVATSETGADASIGGSAGSTLGRQSSGAIREIAALASQAVTSTPLRYALRPSKHTNALQRRLYDTRTALFSHVGWLWLVCCVAGGCRQRRALPTGHRALQHHATHECWLGSSHGEPIRARRSHPAAGAVST
jgi:serine/threonine protein kinase